MTSPVRHEIRLDRPGDPPQRISLDMLADIVDGLREAAAAVAADLGGDPPDVALVGLGGGSTVLSFEEFPRAARAMLPVIFGIALDATSPAAFVTPTTRAAIARFGSTLGRFQDSGWVVEVDGARPRRSPTASASVTNLRPAFAAQPRQTSLVEEEPPPIAEDVEDATVDSEPATERSWRVEFDAEVLRLEKKKRVVWLRVDGRNDLRAMVGDAVFAQADADRARWQLVRVTAFGRAPLPGGKMDVESIAPAFAALPTMSTPLDSTAHAMEPALDRFRRFRAFKQDWDGEGASPIDPGAIERAQRILRDAMLARAVEPPFVAPVPDGSVTLEWTIGDRELALFVRANGPIFAVKSDGDADVEESADADRAQALIAWVHEGHRS